MELPVLTTERLILTVAGPERAEAFAAFNLANEQRLVPWEPPWAEGVGTAAYWHTKLAAWQLELQQGISCRFAMFLRDRPEGPLVGQANLSNFIRGALQAANLGYRLGGTFEGQGLMFEALKAVLQFAFDGVGSGAARRGLGLHRVCANYQPINVRSGALLRRLGFVVEGYARDYLFAGGRWTDHILTSLVNPTPMIPPPPPAEPPLVTATS